MDRVGPAGYQIDDAFETEISAGEPTSSARAAGI
jgi:hypothetical protein